MITAKDVQEMMKKGAGSEEFAQKIGVTVEQLFPSLEKIFKESAKNYERKIKKNDKRKKGAPKAVVTTERKEDQMSKEVIEEIAEEVTVEIGTSEETSDVIQVVNLETLREAEREQQEITAKQELKVKFQNTSCRDKIKEIADKEAACIELQKKVSEIFDDIERLSDEIETIRIRHNEELDLLHLEQEKLQKIRDEIAERSVIYVFLYSDGSISAERNGAQYELHLGNWKDIKDRLEKEFFEQVSELSLKQLIQLSKVLSIQKGECYDYTFDQEEVEVVFICLKDEFA